MDGAAGFPLPSGVAVPAIPVTACPPLRSAANVKKWEIELQTLRESNARLTTALQESAASVEQWKRQFSLCRDENDRLRNKVGAGSHGDGSLVRGWEHPSLPLPTASTWPLAPGQEDDPCRLPLTNPPPPPARLSRNTTTYRTDLVHTLNQVL